MYASLPVAERDRLLWERRLTVAFVNPLTASAGAALDAGAIRISGGERAGQPEHRGRRLAGTRTASSCRATAVAATSRATVCRSSPPPTDATPPAGFDPLLSAVDFSFKVDCPTDFDCRRATICPPSDRPAHRHRLPRQGLRDLPAARCSTGWRCSRRTGASGTPADAGIALVELLAYVGDDLALPPGRRRDRGLPRHRAPAGLGASATPGSSTTRCTTAATRGPGSRSSSTTRCPPRGSSSRGSTPSPTSSPLR